MHLHLSLYLNNGILEQVYLDIGALSWYEEGACENYFLLSIADSRWCGIIKTASHEEEKKYN